jgi:hypothetical protein
MTTAFQTNAFQPDAFQVDGGVTSGAITGGLSYTNNNDVFAGAANLGAAQVTGGWPIYYPRRKRVVVPEVIAEPAEVVTARLIKRQHEIAVKLALSKEERRSKAITEQLRAIYAEQDALAAGIEYAQGYLEQQDEEEALILLLAS